MSTTTCPKCGSPLRPGAKFCGNCGNVISTPPPAPPASASPPPQAGVALCPHCGKPLRVGAKFCNNCGKTISAAAPVGEAAKPAPVAPAPVAQTPPPPPPPVSRPVQAVPPSSRPVAPVAAASAAKLPKRKRSVWPIVVLGLVVVCLAAVAILVVFWKPIANQVYKVIGRATLTPIASATTKPTLTLTPGGTKPAPTNTTAPTPLPASPTVQAPTKQPVASETPKPTDTPPPPTPTTGQPSSKVVFEETFDGNIGNLRSRWVIWGDRPAPKIQSAVGSSFLELGAYEGKSGDAGIATKQPFILAPGTVIEYSGQLLPQYPGLLLVFDWDPHTDIITPFNGPGGPLHIEISNTDILVDASNAPACSAPLDGTKMHKIQIKILAGGALDVVVDDSASPICSITNTGLPSDKGGHIYITGAGWVDVVKVTGP
jgi:hypothetical protein